MQKQKIIDAFMFFNELSVLDVRLALLDKYVDFFIIIEADRTHSGEKKESIWQQNKHLFTKYAHKIVHRIIKLTFDNCNESNEIIHNKNSWNRENIQRNYIVNILEEIKVNDDDIILVSDVDEIPNLEEFNSKKQNIENDIFYFKQKFYYYSFDNLSNHYWTGTFVSKYKNIKNTKLSNIRNVSQYKNVIENGGWHFSCIGNAEDIIKKLKSFAHTEYKNLSIDHINKSLKKNISIIPSHDIVFYKNSDELPSYVKEKIKKMNKKIINITPGLIPIPPNGWGAVEKIIWEIHQNLLLLGYDSQIKYLDEIDGSEDIVHIHVANLANMAYERGIPYYFTFHDHHAYIYGKDSKLYEENLKAIKNAKRAFVPAKYLIDYFEGIPEYLSHGVNSDFFQPADFKEHKLLCVANNGFAYDQSEDRKGFGLAIQAAQILGLPITIAGPKNNEKFFEKNNFTYDKLTILYDLSEDELRDVYKDHTIFLHPSIVEAGHPNLTILEAMASGLPVVGTFEPNNELNGIMRINRNTDEIIDAIIWLLDSENYLPMKRQALEEANNRSWNRITNKLLECYEHKNTTMKDVLINSYKNTKINIKPSLPNRPSFNINFIDGPFVEIKGGPDVKYKVKFINKDTNIIEHFDEIGKNCWIRASKKYFINWQIIIDDGTNIFKYDYKAENKRVYIALDSKAIGDTIAWFPYVEEFRKKWNCEVICSTFHNNLFQEEYKDIQFVNPGEVVHNLYAMYTIGWFHNSDNTIDYYKNPFDFKLGPLQKTSSDILGIEYKEIIPKIKKQKNIQKENLITIAIHSTTQAKYWNNPKGWQELVDYLKDKGYKVLLLSREENGYMGNWHPDGIEKLPQGPLENVIEMLQKSKMFIGISSGLSWLSWVSDTKTCIISGFTEPFVEPYENIIKINPKENICKGCITHNKLDPGDWNWCPIYKGTERQFECSKSITSEDVIKEIEPYL